MRAALHRQAEGTTPATSASFRLGASRRSFPNVETLGYSQTSLRDEDEILVVEERARVLALSSQSVISKPGRGQHGKYAPYAFPEDFMVKLSAEGLEALRCQIGTSNTSAPAAHSGLGRGGRRYQAWMAGETKGVALQDVNIGDFRRMPLLVPPLAEQHRIVAKVDELIALCNRLEAQFTTTQTQSRHLLEALLQATISPQ